VAELISALNSGALEIGPETVLSVNLPGLNPGASLP
jgi:hypothetical protein